MSILQHPEGIELRARVRIEHGNLISTANRNRLVLGHAKDTRKSFFGYGDTPGYRETYVIMKEPSGWIWRSVTDGMGANGHHKTLRQLVVSSVVTGYWQILVLNESLPESVFEKTAALVERNESRFRRASA